MSDRSISQRDFISLAETEVIEAFMVSQMDGLSDRSSIAAALRALADQVVPANGSRKNNEIRAEILAIATELEGGR